MQWFGVLRLHVLLVSLLAASSLWAGPFDGQRWKINATPDEATAQMGQKEFADTVNFAEGKFSSTALGAKGFRPAAYRSDVEEREAEFEATQESQTEGVAVWLGEIHGDKVVGRLQWKKKDGTVLVFNFSGTKELH